MKKIGRITKRGQSLVEVALVLPILLLILLGLVDFGRVYYVTVSLFDAADEGAMYAAAFPDPSKWAEARRRAASATSALITLEESDVDDPQFETWPAVAGTAVTVTVHYDFTFYTPVATMFFPDSTVTLRGQAVKAVIGGN